MSVCHNVQNVGTIWVPEHCNVFDAWVRLGKGSGWDLRVRLAAPASGLDWNPRKLPAVKMIQNESPFGPRCLQLD